MSVGYKIFKAYVKLIHDTLLIRRRYVIGGENVPEQGKRYFIVCNHQNTGNDPLNIVFALPFDRRTSAMARANVFDLNKTFSRLLDWLGIVPAYRFDFEGAGGIDKNYQSFGKVGEKVNAGMPLIIFPEAGHTQGHYMKRFTSGTVRIAMQTAEQLGWTEDIMILPTATHYSDYFEVQTDFMWMVAKPISLKPYYEEYQKQPNSVMRKITHQMQETIRAMMLDEGEKDYVTKDFLRCSTLHLPNRDSLSLPEQLKEDKVFAAKLNDNAAYEEIIRLGTELMEAERRCGVTDQVVARQPGWTMTLVKSALMLALMPLWLVCLWPHALCYWIPFPLLKTDKMFTNTYRYVISALVLYPLTALITLLVMGLGFGLWWQAVVWILLWIPTAKLGWCYYCHLRDVAASFGYLTHVEQMRHVESLRAKLRALL